METISRYVVALMALCSTAAGAFAAPGGLNVLVVKETGSVVAFKGKTKADGSFATGELEPGNYIVQFNAATPAGLKGKQYSIAAIGGKRAVTASDVAGEKFSGGGVAMKVEVAAGSKLTGQVAAGESAALEGVKTATAEGTRRRKGGGSDSLRRMQDLSGQGAARNDGSVGRSPGTAGGRP